MLLYILSAASSSYEVKAAEDRGHERYPWSATRWWGRRAPVPFDQRPRQAGRALWRHYRIIDITLSNCINSGLRSLYPYPVQSLSLNRHIREGWTGIVAQEFGEFFELLPPMQRTGANWYMGQQTPFTRIFTPSAASSPST